MGLTIALEAEDGAQIKTVTDPKNRLHRLLPSHNDTSFVCLRFIDRYGDTVFNYLQMEPLVRELDRVGSVAATEEDRSLVRAITQMAEECRQERHLYLKFYGD